MVEFARFERNRLGHRFRDVKFLGMEFLFMTMKLYIKQMQIDSCFIQRLNVIIACREHFHIYVVYLVYLINTCRKELSSLNLLIFYTYTIITSNYYKDNKDHKKIC